MEINNRIGIFTDQHLRSTGSFPPFNKLSESGLSKELDNIIRGFYFVADQIRSYKPRAVFSLGDAFHNPEVIDVPTLEGASRAFGVVKKACDEVGADFYILVGNHDVVSENPTLITSVSVLEGFGQVIKEPYFIDIDEFTVSMVPYSSNPSKMYSQLKEAEVQSDLILTHIDVAGCRYENNHLSESEIDPTFKVPVISGDIHFSQHVGSVIYPGSLVQNKFTRSDLSGIGGAAFYDLETKEYQLERNIYSKHYVKAHSIEEAKKHDPNQVIIQLVTDVPKEEAEIELEDYEFNYLPAPKVDDNLEVEYENVGIESPEVVLRTYINQDRPSALKNFDETLKSRSESNA